MIIIFLILMLSISSLGLRLSSLSSIKKSFISRLSLSSSPSSSITSSTTTTKETKWKTLEQGVDICDLEICIDDDIKNYETIKLSELVDGILEEPLRIPPSSELPLSLNNKYYGLRHGQSEANIAGIISSEILTGSTIHGLTPLGRDQAKQAAIPLLEVLNNNNNLIMISSNFTRARETAQECLNEMERITSKSYGKVIIRNELRERWFGRLDGAPLIWYNRVWPIDRLTANNKRYSVESVTEVVMRISGLIYDLEKIYKDKTIVLVSHADTLQIAQTFMSKGDTRKFADYRFKNGEVRHMTGGLPVPQPIEYK